MEHHMHMTEDITTMMGMPGDHAGHDVTGMMNHGDHDVTGMMNHGDHGDMGMGDHLVHGGSHSAAGHYGWFHSTLDTIILFESWTTSTWQAVLFSCLGIFFVAVLYEGLRAIRGHAIARFVSSGHCCRRLWHPGHIGLSFLHVIQVFISYLLMLVFMTFNVYLCAALLLGAFVGYFSFHFNYHEKKDLAYEISDHCN